MSNIGSSYMSDAAILAWVNAQQNRLYDDLKATMSSQEERARMASDLADLKKDFEMASRHTEKFPEVSAKMEEFIARYGDNPDFAELVETVSEIKTAIDAQIAKGPIFQQEPPRQVGSPAQPNDPNAIASDIEDGVTAALALAEESGDGSLPQPAPPPADGPPPKYGAFTKESIASWLDAIDKKLDASGTNEQLGMIHINEVKSTIDQGTQVASQLIKSSNDSLSAVINNIA